MEIGEPAWRESAHGTGRKPNSGAERRALGERDDILAGCNVGEDAYGSGLLTTVSSILGNRKVQAFENAVYWWSGVMIGSLKEAQGSKVSSSFSAYTIELSAYIPIL